MVIWELYITLVNLVGKGKYAKASAPEWLDDKTGVQRNNDTSEIGRRTRYYMNRSDDLATESQKIASYNMMVFMTHGNVSSQQSGLTGIQTEEQTRKVLKEKYAALTKLL
jgi:hypothetical protein